MKFYVADSSYGNLLELGKEKLYKYTEDDHYVLGMDALNPFFQLALTTIPTNGCPTWIPFPRWPTWTLRYCFSTVARIP